MCIVALLKFVYKAALTQGMGIVAAIIIELRFWVVMIVADFTHPRYRGERRVR